MIPTLPHPLMAYVDTSAALAMAFREEGWERTARWLAGFPILVSSHLLEAEMRAAYERNKLEFDATKISGVGWVAPNRSLGREMARAIAVGGYLKGADLLHIAIALYVAETLTGKMAFVTLDNRLREVAGKLGFEVTPAVL